MSEYNVIEILSDEEIIIDYGSLDGASRGETVRIYEVGPVVYHPVSKDDLGTLDYLKETMEIDSVYPKFSLCKKIRKKSNSILGDMASYPMFGSYEVFVEKIKVDADDISGKKLPHDDTIKIMDRVRIVG